MFGAGEFDTFFGDARQLPIIRQIIALKENEEAKADGNAIDSGASSWPWEKELVAEENVHSKNLSRKLLTHLNQLIEIGSAAADKKCRKTVRDKLSVAGGKDLLETLGYVYLQEGKQRAGRLMGMEGLLSRMSEKLHTGASFAEVAGSALHVAWKAAAVMKKPKAETQTESTSQCNVYNASHCKNRIAKQDQDLEMLAKMHLKTVWRVGKMQIGLRVRRACEMMFSSIQAAHDVDRHRVKILARALIQVLRIAPSEIRTQNINRPTD